MSKIEQYERLIVFTTARVLPLLLSVVATLILAVSAVAILYSIVPSWKPSKPDPVPEPQQISVSNSEITDYLNRSTQTNQPVTKANPPNQPGNVTQNSNAPAVPIISPEAKSIASEIDAIRIQSAALKLPWANEYQTVCQQVYFGMCYGQRTVIASRGVIGYIDQAFSHHNDGTVSIETVQVGSESYRINPSHRDVKLAILKELEAVLTSAKPEDARKLLNAWGKIREERERERDKTLRNEQEQSDMDYAKAQTKYQATVEEKHRVRSISLNAVWLALGGFVLLGLILAVLAVERHTRVLEAQLAAAKSDSVHGSTPVSIHT
jgi:hypothetical protein